MHFAPTRTPRRFAALVLSLVAVGVLAGGLGACRRESRSYARPVIRVAESVAARPAPAFLLGTHPDRRVPAGSLRIRVGVLPVMLLYVTAPGSPPQQAVRDTAAANDYHFADLAADAGAIDASRLDIIPLSASAGDIAPAHLELFGRGLSTDQRAALAHPHSATVLRFTYPSAESLAALVAAHDITARAAERMGALIFDGDTGETFTVTAWRERRMSHITPTSVTVSAMITLRGSPDNGGYRAITLGMLRFGLPDLAVNNLSADSLHAVDVVVPPTLQTLVENPVLAEDGIAVVRLGDGRAVRIPLIRSDRHEGDAENRLMEIDGIGGESLSPRDRIEALLASLAPPHARALGARDDDAELEAASVRARTELPRLRAMYSHGQLGGATLTMKAPLRTASGGSEYVWVRVTSWSGAALRGILLSTPFDVPGVRPADEIAFEESTVFDYRLELASGEVQGDETSAVLARHNAPTR